MVATWVEGPISVTDGPSSTSAEPPGMSTRTRSPTRPHSWATWAAAQAPGAAGLGDAGAPLPHPEREGVGRRPGR